MKLVHHVIHRNFPTFGHNEDIFQEGCIGLIKAADSYNDDKGTFPVYAYTCILNTIRAYFRRNRKHEGLLSLDFMVENDDDESVSFIDSIPDEYFENNFTKVERDMFIDTLSDKERTIVNLRKIGMTYQEIGNEIGVPKQSVDKVLSKVAAKWRFYSERN